MVDRRARYYGQVPIGSDELLDDRYLYEGLGLMFRDLMGEATLAAGFAIVPNSPAALNIKVGPGRVYKFETLEATVFSRRLGLGGLDADTADDHKITKQGLMRDTVTLNTPAPGTVGYSINYLVQATFAESDSTAQDTNIFNAANPASPTTESLSRERRNRATVSVKAGTAATTGTQATPSPDAGYVSIGVVTVAYGQTTVIAGNIAAAPGAPLVPNYTQVLAFAAQLTALKNRDRLLSKKITTTIYPTTNRPMTTTLTDIGPQGQAAATPVGKVRIATVRVANIGAVSANADLNIVDGGTNDGYRVKNYPVDPFTLGLSATDFERVVVLTAGQKLQHRASANSVLSISVQWIEDDAGIFLATTQKAVTNALVDVTPFGSGSAITPTGKVRTAWVRLCNIGGADSTADIYVIDTLVAANANDGYTAKAIPVTFNTTASALDFEKAIQLTYGQKLQIKAGVNSVIAASVEFAEDAV